MNTATSRTLNVGEALVLLVNAIIIGVAIVILALVGFSLGLMATGVSPSVYFTVPAKDIPLDINPIPGLVTAAVLAFLTLPFAVYPVLYAADNAGSLGSSLREGFTAARRNYFPTLLLVVVTLIVVELPMRLLGFFGVDNWIGTAISLLLGALLSPLAYLAQAHAYRQVSGDAVTAVPTEASARAGY